jgi:hypothetical protein
MPAKPGWYGDLHFIIGQLRDLPRAFVDRATVEFLLRVGRRRAQQIIAPCITEHVGTNGLADRDLLITRLRELADGNQGHYEIQRRRKVAVVLHQLRRERIQQRQLLVEAPSKIVNQDFQDLPPGIRLEPGRVTVEFNEPREALEKFLALAMAISNDFAGFERSIRQI